MNLRYDDVIHATDDGVLPVCGNAMTPAESPEVTTYEVDCWECLALIS